MVRFQPPPRGSLSPNEDDDPLKYYYSPVVGRVYTARINLGLHLLRGRYRRVLEIGYGSGLLLPTLAELADEVDGLDLVSQPETVRAELARLGTHVGTLSRASVCQMPYEDGRYDLAVAFSIFEHLHSPELALALAEAARVLAPGGHLLVGCPAVNRMMSWAFRAIGFAGIEQHHFSGIGAVLSAALPHFAVEKRATLPPLMPLAWAPYSAVLLRKRAAEDGGDPPSTEKAS